MCYKTASMRCFAVLALVAVVLGTILVPVASADPCTDLCEDHCCDQACERCECCAPAPPPAAGEAASGTAALHRLCGERPAPAIPFPPPRDILHVPEPSSPR